MYVICCGNQIHGENLESVSTDSLRIRVEKILLTENLLDLIGGFYAMQSLFQLIFSLKMDI